MATGTGEEKVKAARRARIVEAALACFVEKGFHQTGMREIAATAGVSLGNLYNHFPGKEALIALIASLEAEELAPMLGALAQGPARPALTRFARDYLAWARQPDNLLLGTEILAELTRRPELAAPFATHQRQLEQALAGAIVRGRQEGTVRGGAEPYLLARWLIDAIEGQALRAALGMEEGELDALLIHLLGEMS
ncbi:TetR/AcrR family transcriptional regulator [Aeromonas schubertii]|uniref:TetR family transcriptional regulator n=1 Tax=Aeromonas schubertii TaxID=652 RepID=A0A0S2SLL7_9GAMM|nr:TetR/AcrR family transcriptional regulator [Aeromonas schubertii]ALP42500.1 TetR family transcriptional regulator [Aeromonas schubertii]MBZ6074483.1 TetR/AcrR family transcriptional regulator [Aeromonas schubertii]